MSHTFSIYNRPAIKNYDLWHEDTFLESIEIEEGGVAADLSGDTFDMLIQDATTNEVKHTLTIGDGVTVTDNRVDFLLPATDVIAFTQSKYKYRIKRTKPGGVVKTIMIGALQIIRELKPE
jgi:hypothetical protein